MNINYIASAGTGKTYSLVSDIIQKIEKEKVSLRRMLILTFTEKAASELKEKISSRIKDMLQDASVPQQIKVRLHRELLFIDSSYTGTFHSVFLRILRKYPEITGIDSSTEILSDSVDEYLQPVFESWLNDEFDMDSWSNILEFFDERGESIKELFITFYKNRGRVEKSFPDIKNQNKKVQLLRVEAKSVLEQILDRFGGELEEFKREIFRYSPEGIMFSLQTGNVLAIKEDDRPTDRKAFLIKRPRSTGGKEIFNRLIKNEEFRLLDRMLFEKLYSLSVEGMDLKVNLILEKYYSFERYVDRKKSEDRVLDFTDILLKTESLLKNHPEIKNALSEKFDYIFVDEFQDTDIVQARILESLARNNLHIYGDPKQCIYTWRDASLDAYFEFIKNGSFENVVLEKNYRSTASIVRFTNLLLEKTDLLRHIDGDYRKPVKWNSSSEGAVERFVIGEEGDLLELQARLTGEIINKLRSEGYRYRDIMVLFRKNQDMEVFRHRLSELGIPAVSYGDTGLFDVREVKYLMNLLRLIAFPEDKINLLHVLKSPFVAAEERKIYLNREEPVRIIESSVISPVLRMIKNRRNITPAEALKAVLQADAGKILCMLSDNPAVVDLVKKLEAVAQEKTAEGYSLREFILWSKRAQVPLPYSQGSDAVVLQTIHRSKGLESRAVILPLISSLDSNTGLNSRGGEVVVHRGQLLFYFPSRKVISKDLHRLKEDIIQARKNEEERLFYVAITRAKERLIFIESEEEKENRFSGFISAAENNGLVKRVNVSQVNFQTASQVGGDTGDFEEKLRQVKKEEEKIKQMTSSFKDALRMTTVTELLDTGDRRTGLSLGSDMAAMVGTAVHHVLEFIDFRNFDIQKALGILDIHTSKLPPDIRDEVFYAAEDILEKFSGSEILEELKSSNILFREMPFTLLDGQTLVEGRIDLVYETDGQIVVLDFKTGRYFDDAQEKRIIEEYSPQALLYKKAVEKLFPGRTVVPKLALLWTGKLIKVNLY